MVGTADSVLIREVAFIQSVLYIEWFHCIHCDTSPLSFTLQRKMSPCKTIQPMGRLNLLTQAWRPDTACYVVTVAMFDACYTVHQDVHDCICVLNHFCTFRNPVATVTVHDRKYCSIAVCATVNIIITIPWLLPV